MWAWALGLAPVRGTKHAHNPWSTTTFYRVVRSWGISCGGTLPKSSWWVAPGQVKKGRFQLKGEFYNYNREMIKMRQRKWAEWGGWSGCLHDSIDFFFFKIWRLSAQSLSMFFSFIAWRSSFITTYLKQIIDDLMNVLGKMLAQREE